MFPLYHYKATVLRVIDGDTVWLRIDRGFREFFETPCRLSGLNAPELSTGDPGLAAKTWLAQRIIGKELYIRSNKLDKYGRPLVTIWEPAPESLGPAGSVNAEMIAQGLAIPDGVIG